MQHQFAETAPGGTVSGRRTVRRQARGLVYEYDLTSTAAERVAVHLVDRVPGDDTEDVGFHREHEPTAWTLSDDDLEMTVELPPGANRTVVLGIAAEGIDLPEDHPAPSVDVEDAGEASASEDAADAPDDRSPTGREPRVDADGGLVDAARGATGGVVSRLVDELEAGTVPESDLEALRAHLGTARDDGQEARLEAVAGELEALRHRQDELADRIDDLSAAQAATDDTLEALEVAHEEDLAAVRADLERNEAVRTDELAALRRDLEADLSALEAEVEAFESTRRALIEGFRGAAEDDGDPAVEQDDDVDSTGDETTGDETTGDETTGDETTGDETTGDEDRVEADPDGVFIPPSRLDEVSRDADADEVNDED